MAAGALRIARRTGYTESEATVMDRGLTAYEWWAPSGSMIGHAVTYWERPEHRGHGDAFRAVCGRSFRAEREGFDDLVPQRCGNCVSTIESKVLGVRP